MDFKKNVMFYIKNSRLMNETDEDMNDDDETEASVKTCPKCGKKACECQCSKMTETGGGDDDDDGYQPKASASTECGEKKDKDGDLTPEEWEMVKFARKNKEKFMAAVKTAFPGEFGEVKQNKGASEDSDELPDDHTNGRNGSCKTEEKYFKY